MDFNLVDLVNDYFNNSLVNKISRAIESDNNLTRSALDVAIPSLLGHLQTQSSRPHSADNIFKLVSSQNGGILKSFNEILTTNNHIQLASAGNNIIMTALGETEQDNMVENIANQSGLSNNVASTLLGLITPATLSLVKLKLLDSGEFNSTSLTSILDLQQDNIKSAIPDELSMLDTHGNVNEDKNQMIDNPIESDTNGNTNTVNKEITPMMTNKPHHQSQSTSQQHVESNQPLPNKNTVNSSFWLTKVLPLLLFTDVLYLAFNIMVKSDRSQSGSNEPTADAESTSLKRIQKPLSRNHSSSYQTNINQHMQPISKPATPETTAEVKNNIKSNLENNLENKLESNAQIEIAQNLQSELNNALSQVANTLGKIVDIPSAKLAADDIRKVTARIDELTEISKTMPSTVKDRLSELIATNLPRLQTLTKNANDIPDVGVVIKAPIQALAASLTNLL